MDYKSQKDRLNLEDLEFGFSLVNLFQDGCPLIEKRKVERFDLQIETHLQVQGEGIIDSNKQLISRDISSDGVFLTTNNPLPVGTIVDLNFLLNLDELNGNLKSKAVNISTSGMVIRTDTQGFAVQFDKQHKVSAFKK